jgi:hypothetical protein
MKSIILKTIIACAALLPFSVTQAGQFGPFNAGDKINVEITARESFKTSLAGNAVSTPVPAGVPKFNVGRKVTFTIGKRGELKGPGFSVSFVPTGSTSNVASYYTFSRRNLTQTAAQIFTGVGSNLETTGTLQFVKTTIRGRTPTVTSVAYVYEKK